MIVGAAFYLGASLAGRRLASSLAEPALTESPAA
jgi:hypothetical protein